MTEGFFRLPDGWSWVRVDEAGSVQLGRQRAPEHHEGKNLRPYLRVANVYEARIDTRDVMVMNFTPTDFERFRLQYGDILLNEGQSKELVGRPAMYREEVPGACFQNTLVRFQAKPGTSPEYALAVFLEYLHSGRFQNICKWTTNIAHLGAERFAAMPFPLPPLPEQRRIVAKLEALQARSRRARDALKAVLPLLERLRQSILAAAFRGDLTKDWREKHPYVEPASELLKRIRVERRKKWEDGELAKMKAKGKAPADNKWKAKYVEPEPVDDSELPELPEGWCWASIDQVAPLQAGYAFSSKGFRNAGVRLLKGVNVRDGWISLDEVNYWDATDTEQYESYRLKSGDTVLAMDRPVYSSGSRATKAVRLDDSWEGALLLQRVGRFETVSMLDSEFLYLFVQSFRFREHLVREQNGTQDGTDLPHVSAGVVNAAVLPVPPIEEQLAVSTSVTRMMITLTKWRDEGSACVDDLDHLDSAILSKAFRGELVPQDPSEWTEVSEVRRVSDRTSEVPKSVPSGKRTADAKRRSARK